MKSRTKHDRNISTITAGDFMRIRDTIMTGPSDESEKKGKETKLRNLSQTRIQNWPDSLQQAKKQRQLEKKKHYFEQEFEKRAIEEEEKKLHEANKKMIIERANKKLFDNQDQLKLFHGKMLFSDVLKEREYQNEIKLMKKAHEVKIDQHWQEVEIEKMKKYDEKEVEKANFEKEKIKHQMDIITKRFHEYKTKRIIEYQDQVVEGQIIKKQAIDAIEKEKQKELERIALAKERQAEFIQANIDLKAYKEVVKQKNREEEKKIEEFALAKEQLTNLKKRKEEEMFQEKQKVRQRLIDKQVEYLKGMKNKEDQVLEKQKKESDEKDARELEEKMRRFNLMKQQIDEHSAAMMKKKRDLAIQDKLDDKLFVETYQERMKELVI